MKDFFKKLVDYFNTEIVAKYGIDKMAHFSLGGWIVSEFKMYGLVSMMIGYFILFAISIIKEKKDESGYDETDIKFALYGGFISIILYFIKFLLSFIF